MLGDRKVESFILEQLLSNALKYTNRGGIKINVQNGVVSVSDTGIGIAKEDIPRIFEKGFTGINGRTSARLRASDFILSEECAPRWDIPCRWSRNRERAVRLPLTSRAVKSTRTIESTRMRKIKRRLKRKLNLTFL